MDITSCLTKRLSDAVSACLEDKNDAQAFSSLALEAIFSVYPSRPYHNLHHLVAMYSWLDKAYADAAGLPDGPPLSSMPPCVSLAVLFHDIVYDPKRHDNEKKSAEMFADMAVDLPVSIVEDTAALIMATIKHQPVPQPSSDSFLDWEDCKLFLDADLSILAASSSSYDSYTKGIRQEYIHYDNLSYREGRIKVLGSMLSTPYLFHSRWSLDRPDEMEAKARSNLVSEIRSLRGS
jgi:predicted metal-dependent HD superfamily phosphohydrolase